jgi:hypothetical protein
VTLAGCTTGARRFELQLLRPARLQAVGTRTDSATVNREKQTVWQLPGDVHSAAVLQIQPAGGPCNPAHPTIHATTLATDLQQLQRHAVMTHSYYH